MSCPQEKKVRKEKDGTDVYEYTSATTGKTEIFRVPLNHIYRCLNGEWTVIKPVEPDFPGSPKKTDKKAE
jgi:hypothetical protein